MTEFYAQPYSTEHSGFYFNSVETFTVGMKALNKQDCEEVEIQFIEGDDHLARLAEASKIDQGSITHWFDELEDRNETETTQTLYLLGLGYDIDAALESFDDVCLYNGTTRDYAADWVNDTIEVPDSLRYYIDFDAIACDMQANGDITEIGYHLIVVNANEF